MIAMTFWVKSKSNAHKFDIENILKGREREREHERERENELKQRERDEWHRRIRCQVFSFGKIYEFHIVLQNYYCCTIARLSFLIVSASVLDHSPLPRHATSFAFCIHSPLSLFSVCLSVGW